LLEVSGVRKLDSRPIFLVSCIYGVCRLARIVEIPKMDASAADTDSRLILFGRGLPGNPDKARGVVSQFSTIGKIGAMPDCAEIAGKAIEMIAVDMIDLETVRKRAVVIGKNNAVQINGCSFPVMRLIAPGAPNRIPLAVELPRKSGKFFAGELIVLDNGMRYYGANNPVPLSSDRQFEDVHVGNIG
jgi:hypothetical protein